MSKHDIRHCPECWNLLGAPAQYSILATEPAMHHLYGTATDPTGLRGLDDAQRERRLKELLLPLIEKGETIMRNMRLSLNFAASDDELDDALHNIRHTLGDLTDILFTKVIDYQAYRERREADRARLRTQLASTPARSEPTPRQKLSIDDMMDLLK